MAWTFYTGGIYGLFLLLGRHNLSPTLAGWVRYVTLEKTSEKKTGLFFWGKHKLDKDEVMVDTDDEPEETEAVHGGEHPCDMLDFLLKKAVDLRAQGIVFENKSNELKITYLSDEDEVADSDKILANNIRASVMSALKSRLEKRVTVGSEGERGCICVLKVEQAERSFDYKTVLKQGDGTGEIVLSRLETEQ